MVEEFVRFLVLGKIPGSESRLEFQDSLLIAGTILLLWLGYSISKIIYTSKTHAFANPDLITI